MSKIFSLNFVEKNQKSKIGSTKNFIVKIVCDKLIINLNLTQK